MSKFDEIFGKYSLGEEGIGDSIANGGVDSMLDKALKSASAKPASSPSEEKEIENHIKNKLGIRKKSTQAKNLASSLINVAQKISTDK